MFFDYIYSGTITNSHLSNILDLLICCTVSYTGHFHVCISADVLHFKQTLIAACLIKMQYDLLVKSVGYNFRVNHLMIDTTDADSSQ